MLLGGEAGVEWSGRGRDAHLIGPHPLVAMLNTCMTHNKHEPHPSSDALIATPCNPCTFSGLLRVSPPSSCPLACPCPVLPLLITFVTLITIITLMTHKPRPCLAARCCAHHHNDS